MAIHLTRIYTKTGDDGTTALGDMTRVPKTSPRLAAYSQVEEANAAIGVALALSELVPDVRALLLEVQNDLFDVGADLCTPVVSAPEFPPLRVTDAYVERLEQACDEYNARLEPLRTFVLPGGTRGAALLHVARTVTRRAEVAVWAQYDAEPETTSAVPARYLNRLSDLLFILCRVTNNDGADDVLWQPGRRQRPPPD